MRELRELDLKRLSFLTRTPVERLIELSTGSDYYYERRTLVRSSGKRRDLLVPCRELKKAQTALYRRLLRSLPPHRAVACVRGRGVRWALSQHSGRPFLLHEDISDFFPSVTRKRVEDALCRLETPPEIARLLSGLMTANNQLPQGAPTSTAAGDLVLFPLDSRLAGLARKEGLTYTRYVDDLALSGGSRLRGRFRRLIRRIVAGEGWVLNNKGGIYGPTERHLLLGAVVNSSPNATREYRAGLRSALRLIQAGRFEASASDRKSLAAKVEWVATLNRRSAEPLRAYLGAAA